MPHLMNCPHDEYSWCLICVKKKVDEVEQLREIVEIYKRAAFAGRSKICIEGHPMHTLGCYCGCPSCEEWSKACEAIEKL